MNRIFGRVWRRTRGVWLGVAAHATLICAAASLPAVQAQSVTGTGDVSPGVPAPPLDSWDLRDKSSLLVVGNTGTGTLTIEDGGKVWTETSIIGGLAGSEGTVIVTGTGSTWENTKVFLMGYQGKGELIIKEGGTVSSATGEIGVYNGSEGTITVTGAGSSWNSQSLYVGSADTGTLIIKDGGAVIAAGIDLGQRAEGDGTLSLSGGGVLETGSVQKGEGAASLSLDGGILRASTDQTDFLRDFDAGDVTIKSGGATIDTNSFDITIAADLQGAGGLTKTGGGVLTLTGKSTYGGDTVVDEGALSIAKGGIVSGGPAYIGRSLGSDGTLNIGAAADASDAVAGNLDTGVLYFGDGKGTLVFNHYGTVHEFDTELKSSGTGTHAVEHVSGATKLTGDNSGFTGTMTISGGVLSVSSDANLGHADAVLTLDGGTLATTASFDTSRAIVLTDTGYFDVATATKLELKGAISGTDILGKQGEGTLVLSGENTYGDTWVMEGTLAGTAGSIPGDIVNLAAVTFDQATDARFAGTISGAGGINGTMLKQGAGTLVLDGTSTLDWTITEGTLETAAARFGGDVLLDGAATTLTFTDAGDAAYGGVISGTGRLSLNGGGTMLLTGDNSGFAGTVSILSGKLTSDAGGTLGGSLEVRSGATLGGSGTVGSGVGSLVTVASGGTLAPGNSIGTLTVDGDLVFKAGSRLDIEVDPRGTGSDRVAVTGDVSLNGGSVVHIGAAGEYELRSTYIILSANGTLTGQFDEVTSNFAFLMPELLYDYGAGTVGLTLARNGSAFALATLTSNQSATANGIESIGFKAGHAVYDAIVLLPDDPGIIGASLDALSGEIHGSVKTVLIEDSRFIRAAANDRMRAAFSTAGASRAPAPAAYRQGHQAPAHVSAGQAGRNSPVLWSQAFGSWGKTDGDGNAASLDRDTGGLLIGADRLAGDWRVGLMAGYSHTTFTASDRASSGKSDNYHLGVYGGTQWGKVAVRTGAAYTWYDIHTERTVSIPGLSDRLSADNRAGAFQAFGELGHGIDLGDTRIEPFANLAYVRLHMGGYGEDGGAAALSGTSQSTETSFTTLGLRGEHTMMLGTVGAALRGMLGWRHAFGQTTPESVHAFSAGDAFTIAGVPIAQDSVVLEAGLDLMLAPGATFGLSYVGQFSDSVRDHGARASLSVRF